jgi:hypothetical protein
MANPNDYPNNHRQPRDGLQVWLRALAIISAIAGFFVGVFSAAQMPSTDAGTLVFAATYGSILSGCLMLWVAAAILDALRVIAANSFDLVKQEGSPSAQTPPGPMR